MFYLKNKNGILIAVMILVITVIHYSINLDLVYVHNILRRLYYLPVILASLTFGLRGGIFFAFCVSLLYIPHVFQHVHHFKNFTSQIDSFIEVGLFFGFSVLIGKFTDAQREAKNLTEQKSKELEKAYKELKEQSEQILLLEQKLHFADKLSILGELFATLAHEVRNPLGSIKGVAEILERRDTKDTELTKILNEEVNRLNEVVSNYLSFVKKTTYEKTEVVIHDFLESIVKLVKPKAAKNRVEIFVFYTSEKVKTKTVFGDKTQLQQLFLNLILNSLNALGEGGKIEIFVSENLEGKLIFKVVDDGIGIEENDKSKIFESFFTTRKDGTGLGLAICKKIVESHNGKIFVESKKGQGTTFVIEF
ncbi:sensor histidine kinase [bacterium]|nr:sensor histidine kinase [bacterium]